MSGEHEKNESCGCGCGCGDTTPLNTELARRWREAPDDEAVCPCAGVDKGAVKAAIAAGGIHRAVGKGHDRRWAGSWIAVSGGSARPTWRCWWPCTRANK